MNVKRIIVDEKDGCVACPFCVRVNDYMRDYYECKVTGRKIFDCTGMKYREYIEKFEEIGTPDWCPLVVDECCEWVGVVIEKSEHSKTVEYKNPHMNIKSQIDYFNPNEFKYCFTCGKRIKYVEVE